MLKKYFIAAIVVLGANLPTTAWAISGKIMSPSSIPIPGALVEIYSGGVQQYSATADSNGDYIINLTAGTYDVFVSSIGYNARFMGTVSFVNQDVLNVHLSPALPGLVGYWRFNEGAGTKAFDSSGYGHHGVIAGAAWTTGRTGTALNFTGVGDIVTIPNDAHFDLTNNFTIMAWIKPASQNPVSIISKYTAVGWAMALDSWHYPIEVRYKHDLHGADGSWHSSQQEVPLDSWTHAAFSPYTGSGYFLSFFTNGGLNSSYSTGSDVYSASANSADIIIGNALAQTGQVRIDEVRVYNRSLSADEISAIFSSRVLSGRVTKHDGVTAIQNYTVEALQNGNVVANFITSSNYVIDLPAGTYDVRASAPGYQTVTKIGIVPSADTLLNFALLESSEQKPQRKSEITLGDNLFNPIAGGTAKISFNVPRAGNVSLRIFDLSGKHIRTLFDGNSGTGIMQKDWDGKDDSGRYVVPGMYFLHYVYPGGKEVRKIGVKK